MPLPLTVNVYSGEPAFSLLSRMAARNFCTTKDFCSDMGLRWDGILDGAPTDVAFLAELAGADASLLQSASPMHLDTRRTSMCDLVLQRARFSGHEIRGCPSCLAEDRGAAPLLDGAAMAIRSAWLHEFSFICTRHAKWLEPLWTANDRRARFDTVARFSELDLTTMPQTVESAGPAAFDHWITTRLSGDRGATWLDKFDFQAATDLCDLLGRRLVRDDFPQLADMTRVDRWHALSKAFDILAQGERAFRGALDEMYDAGGAANDGPAKRFGLLYTNCLAT